MGGSKPSQARFAPEPVETTSRSHRKNGASGHSRTASRPSSAKAEEKHSRIKPQPIETTTRSHHKDASDSKGLAAANDDEIERGRKFTPELVETTRRSRKSTHEHERHPSRDRTETSPGAHDEYSERRNSLRKKSVTIAADERRKNSTSDGSHGIRPGGSASHVKTPARQHSYRPPALDSIESSESEESEKSHCPSLSNSRSASSGASSRQPKPEKVKEKRESCDEESSGYLLRLAAKAAEDQMRDQAMAAFPNPDFHEPVDHFAIDRETEETEQNEELELLEKRAGIANRRDSAADLALEMQRMRAQKERAQNQREQNSQGQTQTNNTQPFGAGVYAKNAVSARPDRAKAGLASNLKSPPMLGSDIKFPWSNSPKPTQFSFEQYNLPRADDSKPGENGLWMGYCFSREGNPSAMRPPQKVLKTPAVERSDPFGDVEMAEDPPERSPPPPLPSRQQSQPAPPIRQPLSDEDIDREFPDTFVTQVFNYLSLGFPVLARKFDDELSKISNVSVEELLADDQKEEAKGFVDLEDINGLGPGSPSCVHEKGGRWHALRLYIREWARQHPEMSGDGLGFDAWGVRARRGSWAI